MFFLYNFEISNFAVLELEIIYPQYSGYLLFAATFINAM